MPAMGLALTDAANLKRMWREALAPVMQHSQSVTVLRDYHAENIMLLADGGQGDLSTFRML